MTITTTPGAKLTGEIRVKVTLMNASDEARYREKKLPRRKIRSYLADAVVDTGAVRPVIPQHVLDALGVGTRGQRVVGYADGRTESFEISGGIIFDLEGRDTLEESLVLGDEVLIGQTVLEKLDLLADCANQRLIPNPGHPDQPISKVRRRKG